MMENKWAIFNSIKNKDYCLKLKSFLNDEYSTYTIYPPRELVFNAFNLVSPDNLKVVIIGQDPYHEPNQAMGLSFSVPSGIQLPPSLINIYKEIEREFNIKMKNNGDLTYLAKQGCLLLNSVLTVRAHQALSHNINEYKLFISDILDYIDTLPQSIVFMLWGNNAKQYKKHIHNKNRLILTSVHPSPLSANRGGWFGNNHFKLANEFLRKNNIKEINWDNN